MNRSSLYSKLPGSADVPWLVSRACAGEWDYRPEWLMYLRHPAFMAKFEKRSRMFVVPDLRDRSVQIGIEVIRRVARQELENREVKHFEVVSLRQHGSRAVPHTRCAEKGCDMCGGVGALFEEDAGSHVDLMGWMAVIRVA